MKMTKLLFIPDKDNQALTSGTTVTIGFVNYYVDNILGEPNKGANINED